LKVFLVTLLENIKSHKRVKEYIFVEKIRY